MVKFESIKEAQEYIETSVVALSSTCIQRTYGSICFPESVLKESFDSLIGKPVLLDHEWKVEKVIGVVVDAFFDEGKKAIVATIRIPKTGNEKLISLLKLEPSPITDVSVGIEIDTEEQEGKKVAKKINFKEISFVFEGADKNAKRLSTQEEQENWWDDPELRNKAPREYFLDPVNRKYPYRTKDGKISCERLKAAMQLSNMHGDGKIYARAKNIFNKNNCGGKEMDKETLNVMTKDEILEYVETLRLKLSAIEKENQELTQLAEIGKKYKEHLQTEAMKLVRLAEGEKSGILKLIDKADIDTLKTIVEEYTEKVKERYKSSAKPTEKDSEILSRETLEKADYSTLLKLKTKFMMEV